MACPICKRGRFGEIMLHEVENPPHCGDACRMFVVQDVGEHQPQAAFGASDVHNGSTELKPTRSLKFGAPDWSPLISPVQYVSLANRQSAGHGILRLSDKLANRS